MSQTTTMFASRPARLTSSLLVRKGDAAPAGKPPLPGPTGPLPNGSVVQARVAPVEARPTPLSGASATEPRPAPAERTRATRSGGGGSGERFTTTLRLDPVRHYRLKLFAARERTDVRDVLVQALDAWLATRAGDCPCLRSETKACDCLS